MIVTIIAKISDSEDIFYERDFSQYVPPVVPIDTMAQDYIALVIRRDWHKALEFSIKRTPSNVTE